MSGEIAIFALGGLDIFGNKISTDLLFLDNKLLRLGTDGDQVLLNRADALNANTALTNVLIGTPVTPALAANSFIVANATADGDILIAGNDGGTSRACLFFDASTPDTYLYRVGGTWTAGATTWTIPAVTLGGAVAGGDQSFTNVGDMTFATGSILASGSTNTNTLLLRANDTTFITFTTGATDACELASVTMSGTWLASGTVTIPAVTLGGVVTGSSSYALDSLGNIGVGAASSAFRVINAIKVFTITDGTGVYGMNFAPTLNATTAEMSGGVFGIYNLLTMGATNTQNWTDTNNSVYYGSVTTTAGATGTISAISIFNVASSSIGAGTVTNLYGLHVQDATGAGTLTNQYGIYIDALTKGATVDYAIYCVGAGVGIFAALPTSNPSVAGKWWSNSGVVTISAG